MRKIRTHALKPGLVALLLTLLMAYTSLAQTDSEVLTNDSVISMVKAGLGTNVIVTKIRTSKTHFNLTTNELIRLKESGINEEIMVAMQGYSESADPPPSGVNGGTTATTATTVMNGGPPPLNENYSVTDPSAPHDVGIYYYSEKGGKKTLTELESNAVTGGRVAGMAGTKLTYGIWMSKHKVKIPGESAMTVIKDPQPVFYFYLNPKDRSMAAVKYFPASVNQFQMVKFQIKDHGREITTGKEDSYYSKTGIPSNELVDFTAEKVGDGIYKVTPKKVLKSGEYGFYLLGTGNAIGATFYDFSVRPVP